MNVPQATDPAFTGWVMGLVATVGAAGVIGAVVNYAKVEKHDTRLSTVEDEVKKLRAWRHDMENDLLGERLRHRTPESD